MRISLALAAVLLLVTACGPAASTCDSSNCQGCCTAEGQCVGGGSTLECGAGGGRCSACLLGQSCLAGACFTPVTCSPKSCSALGATCGSVSDGCGGTLTCGTCSNGQTCGGGGTPNVCGTGTCTPRSCASEGFECGTASDGCAAVLNCGTCSSGSMCSNNHCACQPRTCASAGKNCGTIDDGCGGTVNCGTCSAPQTCGGGGTANVCGTGSCTPTTCAAEGKTCGTIADGCGGTLSCGTCTAPQTCGGGGTANVCGVGSCTPTTCAAQGKTCGTIGDGCGGMLSCGSCTAPQTCGGGGVANVCGATCAQSCPMGFSCDASGACAGGSLTSLSFDVRTHTVSGIVSLNGAAPLGSGSSGSCSSSPRGWVELSDATRGYSFSLPIACMGTPAPFTGLVHPGTYRVVVRGNTSYSNLPGQAVEVQSSLVVSSDVSNLSFDVRTHTVSGIVSLNGAAPLGSGSSGTCSSSPRGWVELDELTKGYSFSLPIACMGAPAPFTGPVYPGTYRVRVRGNTSYSNLPGQAVQVQSTLVVSSDVSNLAFDVRTHTVSGIVSLNGAAPLGTGSSGTCSSSPRGWVELTDATRGYSFSLPIACMGTPAPFTGLVYPGTYRVVVRGQRATTAKKAMAPPTVSRKSPRGWVELTDATRGYSFSLPIACMGTPAPFTGLVFPGTYRVVVRGNTPYSNLPGQAVEMQAALVVSSDVSSLAYDVVTRTVSGTVTLNGAAPLGSGSSGTCSSSPRGWVELDDTQRGYSFSLPIACMGTPAPFTGLVYPGTYRVAVRGNTSYSNLPGQTYVVVDRLVVP